MKTALFRAQLWEPSTYVGALLFSSLAVAAEVFFSRLQKPTGDLAA